MKAKIYVLKGCLVSAMVMAVVMWAQTSSLIGIEWDQDLGDVRLENLVKYVLSIQQK
jgi:hypothetical protein